MAGSKRRGRPGRDELPFRLLAQHLPTPCWISDETGELVWVNDAWLAYTGMTVDQARGGGLEKLHDPTVFPEVRRRWARAMRQGTADEMVFPLRGRDGAFRPFLTRVVPLRDRTGTVRRWFGTNTDVSSQTETEARLRSKEEQLREVFDAAGDGIFIVRDGCVLDVNPAACALAGCAREELVGRSLAELLAPEDVERLAQAETQPSVRGEWRIRRKDGRWTDLEVTTRALSDGRRIGIARDISEAKRAHERLAASEVRFRELVDNAPVMIWQADSTGRAMWRNRAMQAFIGRPTGSGPAEGVHPDDRDRVVEAYRRAFSEGTDINVEMRVRRADGAWRWLRASGRPQRDAGGEITSYLGSAVDITEVREATELLAREKSALEARVDAETARARAAEQERLKFWEASRDLLAIISARSGVPLHINGPAWRATLGYDEAEITSMRLVDLCHPEDRERTLELKPALASKGTLYGFENRYRHKDGRWVWLSWNVVREGDLNYSIARDITEEKARAEHAQRAQRLEALGQLTGGVAHDFNNLLTTILGALDLIQRKPDDRQLRERLMTAALAAVRRGERLNRQLLSFARREPTGRKATDLPRLLQEMEPLLRSALPDEVSLRMELAPEVLGCAIDPAQLESAVLNLVVNARDAMPEGGIVTVRTRPAADVEVARYSLGGEAAWAVLEVLDTGQGMPPEVASRAFEPFFTTKEIGRGSGLGLSQVYGAARQAGGSAVIDSTPGQGTAVRIFLQAAEVDGHDPVAAAPPPRASRLLLVEDDLLVGVVTESLLAEAGYEVVRACDAAEALAALRTGRFDVLMTDIRMPGPMNGVQLAREATRRQPGLRVLICSGWTAESLGMDLAAMPWRFLAKPFDETQLRQALAEAAAQPAPG